MKKIYAIFVCLLFIGTIFAVSAGIVTAKKKKPDDGPTPTGTLYFYYDDGTGGHIWTMNADGSSKTKGIAIDYDYWRWGSVSRIKHGDHYWYVGFSEVDGTYPDGLPRQELYAIRDDNQESVQLTNDATLATSDPNSGKPIWGIDDDCISWIGKKWVQDGTSWTIDEFGIYSADISFDSNGDVTGLSETPTLIFESGYTYLGEINGYDIYKPNVHNHDWSPDETELVVMYDGGDIYIVTLSSSTETFLTDNGNRPRWAPDGTKISFRGYDDTLKIINPDGTSETILVQVKDTKRASKKIEHQAWSPDSKFLSYTIREIGRTTKTDIYIIGIDGNGDSCPSSSLSDTQYKCNWDWR